MTRSGRGWLVVGSTAAGSSGESAIEVVAGRLSLHGPTSTAITGEPDELVSVTAGCGDRTLVVVGGDGSAHAAANAMARAGVLDRTAVALVPLGTANDFARGLGMDTDPRAAADQIAGGEERQVDVLRLDGAHLDRSVLVVNALHAGLGVDGARRATPLKPVLGPVAYPVGVAAGAVTSSGRSMSVTVDGAPIDVGGSVLAVAVANGPRLGGVELMAGAEPDDRTLDVLVVPARPWRARVGAALHHVLRSTGGRNRWRGRVVELEGDLGEVDADGEHVEVGSRCRVEVEPGRLRLVVPDPSGQPPTNKPTAKTTP